MSAWVCVAPSETIRRFIDKRAIAATWRTCSGAIFISEAERVGTRKVMREKNGKMERRYAPRCVSKDRAKRWSRVVCRFCTRRRYKRERQKQTSVDSVGTRGVS